MKKIVFITVPILILFIAGIMMYFPPFTNYMEEQKIKDYAEAKYGYDIEIKSVSTTGLFSDSEYVVFPKDHQDLEFKVIQAYDSDKITDDHVRAIEADKAFHKLENVIPAIESLGFQGPDYYDEKIRVDYSSERKLHYLNLYSSKPLEIASFKEEELERFFTLQSLLKQSGADITHVAVTDLREPADSNTVTFTMEHIQNVNTMDDFFIQIKRGSWELSSFYENKKWEAERAKVENDRFTFQSDYDNKWFNCRETNEKGECANIFVTVYFNENSLTQSNVHLEQDLNAIFTLFEKTITPRAAIEYNFIEKGSDDSIRFLDKEIAKYENTSHFIRQNFK